MKPKHFLTNITIAFASVLMITSCSKEAAPSPQPTGSYQPPKVLNVVADDWVQQAYTGMYVNPFIGILQNRGAANVYLEGSEDEMLLSPTPADFATGEIWITTSSTDLIINFRDLSGDPLPFSRLNIKIVFND
ncbi:MAG TPA: hypothetical protein VEV83_16125 [Parafilimonas sp.]|nr:hypothetical protein [Parafilimonas sp.]